MRQRMMMMTASALALALAACGSKTSEEAATPATDESGAMPADVSAVDTGAPAAAATSTGDFVAAASSGGMYEVESGKLAQEKSKSAAVKELAAMMVTDHSKAGDELKAAATKATPPITVATTLNAEHQQMMTMLRNATDFDSAYLDQQRTAHEKTLALLDGYAAGGDTPAIKDWATKTKPVVQRHLDRVKEVADKR